MKNWSTAADTMRNYPERYTIWKLEQLVNFGLDEGEKIDEKELRRYFTQLDINPERRKLFELLLNA